MDDTSKKSEPAVRRVVWGRQFLASTVVVPPDVAEHLNTDAMAVLAVIRNEAQASGKCSLPLARIAERANIGRAKARAAIRLTTTATPMAVNATAPRCAAAQGFGVSVKVFEARRVADVAEAFYSLERSHVQGVLILSSPLFGGNPQMIADLAVRRTVPTISLFPDIAREGGLLAYGPEIEALYRQAAGMARKVLDGARVAELPAERPTRFQLVANLRTAKLFGITLPPSILLRADEVIE